jgi:hypothetical protein
VVLAPLAVLALALAPATGLLTLPLALMAGGLAVVLAQDALGRERGRAPTVATLVGLGLSTAVLVALLIAAITTP